MASKKQQVAPVAEVAPVVEQTPTVDTPQTQETKVTEPTQTQTPVITTDVIDPLAADCPIEDLRDRYTDAERAEIKAAFERGLITRERADVTISAKAANLPTDQTISYWAYCPTGVSVDSDGGEVSPIRGMQVLSNGKILPATPWKDRKATNDDERAQKANDETKGVVDHWFYGYDLSVRSSLRTHLAGLIAGPTAEISKAVKAMFVNKLADSHQEAFDMVLDNRKRRNLPTPDGLTLESLKINWGK